MCVYLSVFIYLTLLSLSLFEGLPRGAWGGVVVCSDLLCRSTFADVSSCAVRVTSVLGYCGLLIAGRGCGNCGQRNVH